MPLVWDETLYNQAYSTPQTREREIPFRNLIVGKLFEVVPGFRLNKRIAIVGCGFGYTMEVLRDRGCKNVVGIDNGPYVLAHKGEKARKDMLPKMYESIDLVPGKYDWVITELVIESFNPETEGVEFGRFLANLDSLLKRRGKVIHIFAGVITHLDHDPHNRSLGLTWQTLEEWVPYAPHHYWIDYHDWRIGGG